MKGMNMDRTKKFEKFLEDCQRGDLMQVLLYVKMRNDFTLENNLALRLSIVSNQLEVTKYLMSKGANPYENTATLYPSIIEASGKGYMSMVKYLWAARHNYYQSADKLKADEKLIINFSLDRALSNNSIEMINFWLEKGGKIQYCYADQKSVEEDLISEENIDYKPINHNGLDYVCAYGHLEVLTYLIDNKHADLHFDNETHLLKAADNKQYEIVKYLIEHGCDKSILEQEKYFDLMYYIEKSVLADNLTIKINDMIEMPVTSNNKKGKI